MCPMCENIYFGISKICWNVPCPKMVSRNDAATWDRRPRNDKSSSSSLAPRRLRRRRPPQPRLLSYHLSLPAYAHFTIKIWSQCQHRKRHPVHLSRKRHTATSAPASPARPIPTLQGRLVKTFFDISLEMQTGKHWHLEHLILFPVSARRIWQSLVLTHTFYIQEVVVLLDPWR